MTFPRAAVVSLTLLVGLPSVIYNAPAYLDVAVEFEGDIAAYSQAADRLLGTGDPYSDELRRGPIENTLANIGIGYFYPPTLAQVFVLFSAIPEIVVVNAWRFGQIMATVVGVAALASKELRRPAAALAVLITLVAYPIHSSFWWANVSGWFVPAIAFMVASPRAAALLAGPLTIAKLTPAPMLVSAVAGQHRVVALASGLSIVTASIVAAPDAWITWLKVLPNVFATPMAIGAGNVSPAAVAGEAGVKALGFAVGAVVCLGASLLAVTRALSGRPVADWLSAAVVAYLFASPTLWIHYLPILIPIAIARWRVTSQAGKDILLVGGMWQAGMWIAVSELLPLRVIGLVLLLTACWVLVAPARQDLLNLRGFLSRIRGRLGKRRGEPLGVA